MSSDEPAAIIGRIKNQLTDQVAFLKRRTPKDGHVHPALMGELMLILVRIYNELHLDLRDVPSQANAKRIRPPGLRQPNDPRPITITEYEQFLVDGDAFRTSLAEVMQRLDAYAPPKSPIGFVR